MLKNRALAALFFVGVVCSATVQATTIFLDDFEVGTAGAPLSAPWVLNHTTPGLEAVIYNPTVETDPLDHPDKRVPPAIAGNRSGRAWISGSADNPQPRTAHANLAQPPLGLGQLTTTGLGKLTMTGLLRPSGGTGSAPNQPSLGVRNSNSAFAGFTFVDQTANTWQATIWGSDVGSLFSLGGDAGTIFYVHIEVTPARTIVTLTNTFNSRSQQRSAATPRWLAFQDVFFRGPGGTTMDDIRIDYTAVEGGEVLYNGIHLPPQWPPHLKELSREPLPVPYLNNSPAVIPIDVGRQLLVDDFLIEQTTLARKFHHATFHADCPLLKPDVRNSWEKGGEIPTVMLASGGVWYDPTDGLFKLWYQGGQFPSTLCYAQSLDGIHWQKPVLDVLPGSNVVLEADHLSSTVWLDLDEPNPQKRYKLALFAWPIEHKSAGKIHLYFSADGIHWSDTTTELFRNIHSLNVVARSGYCGDRTTIFYNPFRKVWVYSLRSAEDPLNIRYRKYWEHPDLVRGAVWTKDQPTFWVGADRLDPPNPEQSASPQVDPDLTRGAQLYTLDATPYESVMLGLFSIMRAGNRKANDLVVGYSRDGFYWDRPDREALIGLSSQPGDWNYDYLQSAGGCCLVVGDKLYFYVGARSNHPPSTPGTYRSVGLATLRRDGFASMDAAETKGTLTTRPVRFSGKHLFVNADVDGGQLQAEILDEQGDVVNPFSLANCIPVTADKTLQQISWKGVEDLSELAGKPVRFRFSLSRGSLYSFWVSPDLSGASHGYVAAGGPGFTGPTDTVSAVSNETFK